MDPVEDFHRQKGGVTSDSLALQQTSRDRPAHAAPGHPLSAESHILGCSGEQSEERWLRSGDGRPFHFQTFLLDLSQHLDHPATLLKQQQQQND